jgi:hypothetical protein
MNGFRLSAAFAAVSAVAAWGQIGGPVSGWVLDERNGSIRPVVGIPGASYLGDAVSGTERYSAAAIQSGRDAFALAVGAEGGRLTLLRALNAGAEATGLEHGLGTGSELGVALSRDGRSGVVFTKAGGRFQKISGLPGRPELGAVTIAEGVISRVAVLNSGAVLVATGGGLYAAAGSGLSPVASGATGLLAASESGEAAVFVQDGRLFRFDEELGGAIAVADAGADATSLAMFGRKGMETVVVLGGGQMKLLNAADGGVRGEFAAQALAEAEIAPANGVSDDVMVAGRVAGPGPRLFLIDLSAAAMARAAESGSGPIFFVPVGE